MSTNLTRLINRLCTTYGLARVYAVVNSVALFRSDPSYNDTVVAALSTYFNLGDSNV